MWYFLQFYFYSTGITCKEEVIGDYQLITASVTQTTIMKHFLR